MGNIEIEYPCGCKYPLIFFYNNSSSVRYEIKPRGDPELCTRHLYDAVDLEFKLIEHEQQQLFDKLEERKNMVREHMRKIRESE